MKTTLPKFDIGAYRDLLLALNSAGYALTTVSEMNAANTEHKAYLRHDVDFFPAASLAMAQCEATVGVHATYYFLLSGTYNLLSMDNRKLVHTLLEMGHEIGLHYDLEAYAENVTDATKTLTSEIRILEDLCGRRVNTITAHCPYRGGIDWFLESDQWINPRDPRLQENLLYVSDSCRAWRDESLLECLSADPPLRLLLLTHPELWLDGSVVDRISYLETIIAPTATNPIREYYDRTIKDIWMTHPGAVAHDNRVESLRKSKMMSSDLSKGDAN